MKTVIWVILLAVAAVVSAAVLSQNDGLEIGRAHV